MFLVAELTNGERVPLIPVPDSARSFGDKIAKCVNADPASFQSLVDEFLVKDCELAGAKRVQSCPDDQKGRCYCADESMCPGMIGRLVEKGMCFGRGFGG